MGLVSLFQVYFGELTQPNSCRKTEEEFGGGVEAAVGRRCVKGW